MKAKNRGRGRPRKMAEPEEEPVIELEGDPDHPALDPDKSYLFAIGSKGK